MNTPLAHWGKLACLGLVPQLAVAAAPVEDELDKLMSMSLMELINTPVVTASRQSETRDQTPAHIVVVTREQIRERRYKNLADLLADMPGVDFQRGTKSSQYNQFGIQGYVGPNKLVIMLDGVRIGHPAGGNIPVAENLALYPARQVEFLYGPAAALYGADAVAGVVNIITDRPADRQGAWAQVGAGNFDSREVSFMAGYRNDRLALNVGGHAQRSDRAPLQQDYPDDFRKVAAGGVTAADREDYVGDISSGSLFARMDLGDRLSFGFYRTIFQSLTSTGDPPATAFYQSSSQWQTTTDTLYGKYRFAPSANLSGELVVDYSRMEVDPKAKYTNFYNGFTNGYSYVWGERLGIEQNLVWTLNDSHRIQAGLGYQKHYAIETASLPAPYDTDKGPQSQGYRYPNTPLPLQIYDARFDNYSAYAQWQAEWNKQFSTMAGVRLDYHSDYGQTVNPRLGAVWRASAQHVFKAMYGEAFRAPSPEEYLSSFGSFDGSKDASGLFQGFGFRVPNFELEPEKAKTLSLTWDWRPRQNLNFVTNLYRSQIENLVVNQPSANIDAIPGAVLISPETKGNAGIQIQKGLDLMAQWRFRLGTAWSGDLWGSASWIRGTLDEGDGVKWEIPYVADRKLKLGLTVRYRDILSITPQWLMVGDTTNGRKRPPVAALQIPADCGRAMTAPERCTTDGYSIVNLHVGWHKLLDGRATLWLDVYNLFDKRYYAAHGSASRTFWDMPQQPRSWMASFEYRF
jgi:outer membrane receptor protein involved in Fe transport